MARLPLVTPDFGLVTLGTSPGVLLHSAAWQCVNSYVLTDGAPKRRKNQVRPNVAGTYGGRGFKDEFAVELEVQIIGDYDWDGSLSVLDIADQEEQHYRYLYDNIYEQAEDDEGRIGAGVTSATPGGVWIGYVQVDRIRREPIKGTSCCFIELTLPSGGFVYTEV